MTEASGQKGAVVAELGVEEPAQTESGWRARLLLEATIATLHGPDVVCRRQGKRFLVANQHLQQEARV